MTIKKTVGVLAKNEMAHADETFIESARELGTLLKRGDLLVLTSFSGGIHYVKESVLSSDGALLSLSPACSKEEHETVFRHTALPSEKILYTGLGRQLTVATLLRSADCVIAIDKGAYDEAKLLSSEEDLSKLHLLGDDTKSVITSLFEAVEGK